MASIFEQGSSTTLEPSNTKTFFRGSPTTISDILIPSTKPMLRGTALVHLLDFLNTHYDSLKSIYSRAWVDEAAAPANVDVLLQEIADELERLFGYKAFELVFQPESDAAKSTWNQLMEGVDYKLANSEDHARWSKLNPHKVYALLPDSGLNYHFSHPGHAEANIGYGIPEWMVRAVQRSPEVQYRSEASSLGGTISIGNLDIQKPRLDNELQAWEEYLLALRELLRPALRDLHPSEGNCHIPGGYRCGDYFIRPRDVSPYIVEDQDHLETHSLDLHTSSRPVQDPRGRQNGHHEAAGLLFGSSMPSELISLPNHSRLLNHIGDENLEQENKEWPSAEADRYRERFAYESTTLEGAKSYLREMSRLPDNIFFETEDVNYAMALKYLQDQNRGSLREATGVKLHEETGVNYFVILANLSIAAERFTRTSRGPEVMERIRTNTREFLFHCEGIKEMTSGQTAAAAAAAVTRTKKPKSWLKECRVILRGLYEAHSECEEYPIGAQGQNLSAQFNYKPAKKMSYQPKRSMIFFR